jgi:hypothetical protein
VECALTGQKHQQRGLPNTFITCNRDQARLYLRIESFKYNGLINVQANVLKGNQWHG